MAYKPETYNSVSPYLIVDEADKFIDFLVDLFDGTELRRYPASDGKIVHAEVMIDDSVIMLSNSSEKYPAIQSVLHVYVREVDKVFDKALRLGCISIEKPKENPGDPDRRGTFQDFWGNLWSVSTQK